MFKGKKLSLILPCKNEEKSISRLLSSIPDFIDEILIVDNNSNDSTRAIASTSRATVLKEKRHINRIGYGFAYHKGINKATGDILICLDADCSYPVSEIKNIVNYLVNSKSDFISCNRLPLLRKDGISFIRSTGIYILNKLFKLLFNYPIKDLLSGMWVFKKSAIPYLDLSEGGWNFSLAIKLSAVLSKFITFKEFHIKYRDREIGSSKQKIFLTGLQHILYLYMSWTKSTSISSLFSSQKINA